MKLVIITKPSGNWGRLPAPRSRKTALLSDAVLTDSRSYISGVLSTHIVNRTISWGNLLNSLQKCGSSLQALIKRLDDDR
jgi:hypothetical protein